ncbi:MAG TPA: glycosyltransferase family 1 protein [Candidatus Krumholzibacteria bacterium]|nr:glycosyltransferase family 1 protein [Candidatus Krumholzibacteria bacterium]
MSTRGQVILDALLVRARPTGVGRSILELCAALAAEDRGFDVTVLASEPGMFGAVEGAPGWRIESCPGARGGTLAKAWYTQRVLPGLVRRLDGGLLHSLQFVAPLRLDVPSVVTVHDLAWQLFPATVEEPRRTYYRLLVGPTLRRAAAIVTNSEATAADVRRLHPACAERVEVTPFGLAQWAVEAAARTGPTPAPGRAGRPSFLFVGTLEPRKNLEGVLKAYRRFLAESGRPPADCPSLLFVGASGWKDSGLRAAMQDLMAEGHLEVRDYCEPGGLWDLYRSAHGLLFPSLHEGFGFPILEAMAAGVPVMTSDRGAMAEVAGDAALLVDPASEASMAAGMARLAWDAPLRADCVLRGHERARQWSWRRTAEATAAVYRRILGQVGGK